MAEKTKSQGTNKHNLPEKPPRSKVLKENIPSELISSNQWVCWKYEPNEEKTDWSKIPYQVNKKKAASTRSNNWCDFVTVLSFYQSDTFFDGIGFVVSKNDNFIGIDVDECLVNGKLSDLAFRIVNKFKTYTEISPSGKGIRLFCFGKLPKSCWKKRPDLHLEMYETGRYLTVTGNIIEEFKSDVIINDQSKIDWIQNKYKKKSRKKYPPTASKSLTLSDNEVIEIASRAKNGSKFRDLLAGKWDNYYNSQSEADFAFVSMLTFYSHGKADQIDRIFSNSGLYREKWDRIDYKEATINKAISTTEKYYTPKQAQVITLPVKDQVSEKIKDELLKRQESISDDEQRVIEYFINSSSLEWNPPDTILEEITDLIISSFSDDPERILTKDHYCQLIFKIHQLKPGYLDLIHAAAKQNGITKKSINDVISVLKKQNKKEKKLNKHKPPESYGNDWKFWYVDEDSGRVLLDSLRFLSFLKSRGFFFFWDKLANGYRFIRITNNCAGEVVTEEQIKAYVVALLRKNEADDGLTFIHKSGGYWFGRTSLNVLEHKKVITLRDTKEKSFIVFKNCVVEVSKNGFITLPFSHISNEDKVIWKDQIINHDFESNFSPCIFEAFLRNTCSHLENKEDKDENGIVTTISSRTFHESAYWSAVSAIGYLVHAYQDPANTKAVVLVDRDPEDGEEDGRRGKGIFANAIAQVRKKGAVNGKALDMQREFVFENINHDTQFVVIDDVARNFKFELIFSLITEGFQVRRKYAPMLDFPPEDSPKIAITSNTVLKGVGSSHRARQHICEFSDFYNDEITPKSVHGCTFFTDDWDKEEWNRFYTFIADCTRYYLQYGLVKANKQRYEFNKALEMVGEEFYVYLNNKIKLGEGYEKKSLFGQFKEEYPQYQKLTSRNLGNRLKQFCKIKNYAFNAHKNGDRDVNNSIEYVTLTEKK